MCVCLAWGSVRWVNGNVLARVFECCGAGIVPGVFIPCVAQCCAQSCQRWRATTIVTVPRAAPPHVPVLAIPRRTHPIFPTTLHLLLLLLTSTVPTLTPTIILLTPLRIRLHPHRIWPNRHILLNHRIPLNLHIPRNLRIPRNPLTPLNRHIPLSPLIAVTVEPTLAMEALHFHPPVRTVSPTPQKQPPRQPLLTSLISCSPQTMAVGRVPLLFRLQGRLPRIQRVMARNSVRMRFGRTASTASTTRPVLLSAPVRCRPYLSRVMLLTDTL